MNIKQNFIEDRDGIVINGERDAWLEMFEEASRVFNIPRKELNSIKYSVFFKMIEQWAFKDRIRRHYVDPNDEHPGCLWDGEKI